MIEMLSSQMDYTNLPVILRHQILMTIGCWFLFNKCDVKKVWAFIPVAREYHISLCADREKDGRVYTILVFFYDLLTILVPFLPKDNLFVLFLLIPIVGIGVAIEIYIIKVYLGLIKVFDKKKKSAEKENDYHAAKNCMILSQTYYFEEKENNSNSR